MVKDFSFNFCGLEIYVRFALKGRLCAVPVERYAVASRTKTRELRDELLRRVSKNLKHER